MSDSIEEQASQRTRVYSTMNYKEYVSVFERPPSKPSLRPTLKEIENELDNFHLDSGSESLTDDLPEIRKTSKSVNFSIGSNHTSSELKKTEKLMKQIEEVKEDASEASCSYNEDLSSESPMNRQRAQTDSNQTSILGFLSNRARNQSLAS